MDGPGPLCLTCADLDLLVFLPAGERCPDTAGQEASGLRAVVIRFSRSRHRYERQGVLVEEQALEQAEQKCLADEDARQRRRLRRSSVGQTTTSSSRPPSQRRSASRSPDARTSGPKTSPAVPVPAEAVGSAEAPPNGLSTPKRLRSR